MLFSIGSGRGGFQRTYKNNGRRNGAKLKPLLLQQNRLRHWRSSVLPPSSEPLESIDILLVFQAFLRFTEFLVSDV